MNQNRLFAFNSRTRVYFGCGSISKIGEVVIDYSNHSRIMIVTDKGIRKAGLLDRVLKQLPDDKIRIVFDDIMADPEFQVVEKGVELAKQHAIDAIIAIGGGSVMDSAKAIMIKYEKPKINLRRIMPFGGLGLRKKVKYLIAIPTTSGTGSEVTAAAMLTDMDRDPPKKLAVAHSEIIPDVAILHTDFVKDMPPFLTMASGLDALSHAAGTYVSSWGGPINDALNIGAIKEILKYLPRAYKYGNKDLEARAKMQLATIMAGMGFGNSRVGLDHGLGHSLGKVFKLHHGFCVGLFLPYTVAYTAKISERWKDLCPIFGVESKGKEKKELLTEFLQAIKNFIYSIDGAVCIKEIKNPTISKEEYMGKLDLLISYAETDAVDLLAPRYMNREMYKKIFEYAWDGRDIDF